MQNIQHPRGRGRPRSFDREAALEKATRVFWAKGFDATSIADLIAAMGIGGPSLYAAFGDKEALYVEAVHHYGRKYAGLFWTNFDAAMTCRAAVEHLLLDSAQALTGSRADTPHGCMVTLSAVATEEHPELARLLKVSRAVALERLEARFYKAVEEGELSSSADIRALARFMQTVQSGMSILARDGASRCELEDVARIAFGQWNNMAYGPGVEAQALGEKGS